MADSLLSRTRTKIRYYKKGLPWYAFALRLSIDALSQAGLRIEPYHLFLEGLACAPRVNRAFDRYDVAFLRAEDMEEIARIPGRSFTSDDLRRRLDEGQRCLGVRYEGCIAAFTWCSDKRADLLVLVRELRPVQVQDLAGLRNHRRAAHHAQGAPVAP